MADPQLQSDQPLPVTLVVAPNFSLLSLALCTDGLRVANRESPGPAYEWAIASEDGSAVVAVGGMEVKPRAALAEIPVSPVTILLTAYEPEAACTPALMAWLRRQDRHGGLIGCVDTAALVLGRAGLLRGEQIAVHHEVAAAFREELGDARLLDRDFAFEGRRLSSAGGVSTLDMLLALIARTRGEALAHRVARVMNHVPARGSDEEAPARSSGAGALPGRDRRLERLVALMRDNLETPVAVAELCRRAEVEASTARRLFRRHLGRAPAAYYGRLRLERARALLRYSGLSIAEIAAAVGFADNPSFSHAFRRAFGQPPSRARRDFPGH